MKLCKACLFLHKAGGIWKLIRTILMSGQVYDIMQGNNAREPALFGKF